MDKIKISSEDYVIIKERAGGNDPLSMLGCVTQILEYHETPDGSRAEMKPPIVINDFSSNAREVRCWEKDLIPIKFEQFAEIAALDKLTQIATIRQMVKEDNTEKFVELPKADWHEGELVQMVEVEGQFQMDEPAFDEAPVTIVQPARPKGEAPFTLDMSEFIERKQEAKPVKVEAAQPAAFDLGDKKVPEKLLEIIPGYKVMFYNLTEAQAARKVSTVNFVLIDPNNRIFVNQHINHDISGKGFYVPQLDCAMKREEVSAFRDGVINAYMTADVHPSSSSKDIKEYVLSLLKGRV